MLEAIVGQTEGVAYLCKVIGGAFSIPLLLVGPEGVGRRFSVLETAKAVFEPDQHSPLEHGRHPDFHLVQVEDDEDIKVESIRALIEETSALPSWAPYKFFVIDGADRLTIAAANALLKALEEPPPKARFFLLSEQREAVIPTIRSRCAVVSYRRLPESFLLTKLSGIATDEIKARVCARASEGSLGRATRCLVSGQLVFRDEMAVVLDHTSKNDLFAAFSAVDKVADLQMGLRFLEQLLRDMLLVEIAGDRVIHIDVLETVKRLKSQLTLASVQQLLRQMRGVRQRAHVAPINLSFHVKSALASVCS